MDLRKHPRLVRGAPTKMSRRPRSQQPQAQTEGGPLLRTALMVCQLLGAPSRLAAVGALALLAPVLTPVPAAAFSAPSIYPTPAADGGGGGRWFSGSPAEGYGCSVCHTSEPPGSSFTMDILGLPSQAGYKPGLAYPITVTWPEFRQVWFLNRPNAAEAPAIGFAPAVGLVAEMVAENGHASGVIEINAQATSQDALCEMPHPNSRPRLGVSLYQVRVNAPTIELQPDEQGIIRCESRQLAQRCLVALTSCGAHRVDFTWTPTAAVSGPVWFSAGFVASPLLSGTPEGDAVDEVSVPLQPAESASAGYVDALQGASCSVAISHGPTDGRGSPAMWLLGCCGLLWSWRRRACRRVPGLLVRAAFALSLPACLLGSSEQIDETQYPFAGLFTPGSPLGASDMTDWDLGERCESPTIDEDAEVTEGMLTLAYSTQTLNGQYAPDHVSAVWIENSNREYVDTIEVVGRIRYKGLQTYMARACQDREKTGVDAITSATHRSHMDPHADIVWDGMDFEDNPAPDGQYMLYIEVTETDKGDGYMIDYPFRKGPMPFAMELRVDFGGAVTSGTMSWMPGAPDAEAGVAEQ